MDYSSRKSSGIGSHIFCWKRANNFRFIVYYAIIANASAFIDILKYISDNLEKKIVITSKFTVVRAWKYIW